MCTYWDSELSRAQDRLTDLLQNVYTSHPQYRELVRMILSTVGRGAEGDVGQRIRDEILVIQVTEICYLIFLGAEHFLSLPHACCLLRHGKMLIDLQRNNDCKGGMMEEWHQKLHNNTSPDDVVICQVMLLMFNYGIPNGLSH